MLLEGINIVLLTYPSNQRAWYTLIQYLLSFILPTPRRTQTHTYTKKARKLRIDNIYTPPHSLFWGWVFFIYHSTHSIFSLQ